MGFKSSLAIAQTTRFKRKQPSPFTPPPTPFNNTSFLIQLQQLREQRDDHGSSPTKQSRFDQYGSMDNIIASSFTAPASPQNRPNLSSGTHSNPSSNTPEECSKHSECSTAGKSKAFSELPEAGTLPCEWWDHAEAAQQSSSCNEDVSSTVTELKIETSPEKREGDAMLGLHPPSPALYGQLRHTSEKLQPGS